MELGKGSVWSNEHLPGYNKGSYGHSLCLEECLWTCIEEKNEIEDSKKVQKNSRKKMKQRGKNIQQEVREKKKSRDSEEPRFRGTSQSRWDSSVGAILRL